MQQRVERQHFLLIVSCFIFNRISFIQEQRRAVLQLVIVFIPLFEFLLKTVERNRQLCRVTHSIQDCVVF